VPVWNESFTLELGTVYDLVTVKCHDDEVEMDEYVGEGTFMASKLCYAENFNQSRKDWHELQHKGKRAALIHIEGTLILAEKKDASLDL
jgi:Ca2+-dependent lipid-binding protein